ncbi:MAG TPA: SGNH/GDSL hydrolase family protein [Jatrophihabitans sp.]|nr:SGNH/GDSL hydrolase family protein [Jatrophihabitans sp.]
MAFEYSNLNERPVGRFVTLAGRLVPGIARVQAQATPYAEAWRRANERALAAGPGPLWVALGDSLSQGIGASRYDRGWVGQLAGQLAAAGRPMRLVNLAVYGARVSDVLDRQLPALRSLGVEPDLVTVLIGSNDLLRAATRRELPAGYELLLQRLSAGAVVGTMPNPRAAARAVNRSIERAVARRGLLMADLRQPRTRSWRGKLAADFFHPNDRGYSDLAWVFARALGLPDEPAQPDEQALPDEPALPGSGQNSSPRTGCPAGASGSTNHSVPKASR